MRYPIELYAAVWVAAALCLFSAAFVDRGAIAIAATVIAVCNFAMWVCSE